jgi:hypothetical protein
VAYYYNEDGDKVPVDDHSSPTDKLKAQQAARDDAEKAEAAKAEASRPMLAHLLSPEEVIARDPVAAAKEAERAASARYQYGGWAGGAHEAASRYAGQGQAAQGRQGEVIDYSRADWDRQQAGYSRNAQVSMADMMARRARGETPSIAQMQADRQMGQAAAEQSSAAASARGPASLALAQQAAAANTANMQSNISNQAQINAANERMQAEQNAMGAFSGIRGGDMQSGAMAAQQAQAQSAVNAQQRAQNDQYQLGMTQNEIAVQSQQLAAQQNRSAAEQGAYFNQKGLEAGAEARSDARTASYIGAAGGVIGAGAAIVGGALAGGALGGHSGPDVTGGGDGHGTDYGVLPDGGGTGGSMSGGSGAIGAGVSTDGNGNPDDDDFSDERAKVPVAWGSGKPSVDVVSGADPQTPPTGLDMSKAIARRALDEQEVRDAQKREQAQAPVKPAQAGRIKQPLAISGVDALKRREEEELALIYAKQRNGAELTEHEKSSKNALRRRVEGAQKEKQAKAAAHGEPAQKPQRRQAPDHTGEYIRAGGSAVGAIGQALASRPAPTESFRYVPPPMIQAPSLRTDSGMSMKEPRDLGEVDAPGFNPRVRDLGEVDAPSFNPRVSADPQMQRASGMLQAQQSATGAALSAGPSTAAAAERVTFPSDPKAKQQAFIDGINHADKMQQTGEVPTPPSYMPNSPARAGVRSMETKNVRTAPGKESNKPWQAETEETHAAAPREREMQFQRERPAPPTTAARFELSSAAAKRGMDGLAKYGGPVGPGWGSAATDSFMVGGQGAQVLSGEKPIDSGEVLSDEDTKIGGRFTEVDDKRMSDAARSMRAAPYAYKPEYAARAGQKPGELNVGPMADEMEKSEVAGTAVERDPRTGMRTIDIPKYTKVLGGVAASQEKRLEKLESLMARRLSGGRR